MKKCHPDCPAICDFCKWYDFNEDLILKNKTYKGAVYVYKGYCNLLKKRKEPCDNCKSFYCKNINRRKYNKHTPNEVDY